MKIDVLENFFVGLPKSMRHRLSVTELMLQSGDKRNLDVLQEVSTIIFKEFVTLIVSATAPYATNWKRRQPLVQTIARIPLSFEIGEIGRLVEELEIRSDGEKS